MKRIILLMFIIGILATSTNATDKITCENSGLEGLCIEVEFDTSTDEALQLPSKYSFPYIARQGDYLWLKRFYAVNLNESKDTRGFRYTLTLRPLDYFDPIYLDLRKMYIEDYGTYSIEIPHLMAGCYYELSYNEGANYKETIDCPDISTESEYRHYFVELYKSGGWLIKEEITAINGDRYSEGHSSIFNNVMRGHVFYVNTRFEMENLMEIRETLETNKNVLIATVIVLIFTGIGIIVDIILSIINLRRRKSVNSPTSLHSDKLYYCKKCRRKHHYSSKIGKEHIRSQCLER